MGKGRAAGRVGSDFLSVIAGRVGWGQRSGGSGRVGSKKSDPWTTLLYIGKYPRTRLYRSIKAAEPILMIYLLCSYLSLSACTNQKLSSIHMYWLNTALHVVIYPESIEIHIYVFDVQTIPTFQSA